MKTNHKLQITYDEGSDTLSARHSCSVEVAGHTVGHNRSVALPDDVIDALIQIIDQNRSEVESEAEAVALMHASALSGRNPAGTKSLKVEGGITLSGTPNRKGQTK